MKLKDYQQSMDRLRVPTKLENGILAQVRTTELNGENISLKENKRKFRFNWVSAVAAALVLAVGLTVIFSAGGSGNIFILRAGAAEITADAYVNIGEILPNGSSMGLAFDSYPNEDTADTGLALLSYQGMDVDRAFSIDNITYEGSNIEQVAYSIHGGGGYFSHDMQTGTTYYVKGNEFGGIYGEPDFVGFDSLVTDASDYHLYFRFSDDTGRFSDERYLTDVTDVDENGAEYHHIEADDLKIFAELFEENKDDIYMDVTATFTDGTTATRRLTFDLVENDTDDAAARYTLQAKLTE